MRGSLYKRTGAELEDERGISPPSILIDTNSTDAPRDVCDSCDDLDKRELSPRVLCFLCLRRVPVDFRSSFSFAAFLSMVFLALDCIFFCCSPFTVASFSSASRHSLHIPLRTVRVPQQVTTATPPK